MASKISFLHRTAIITGASGALGRSYALELAKRGCNIVCNDLGGSSSLHDLVQEINDNGGTALADESNVLNAHDIVENSLARFGRIDVLINNAGILRDKSFHKATEEDWKAVIDVHLNGTYRLCHAVWPHMQQKGYGRIVNVTSGAGLYGNFGQSNYSAAKLGIVGLSQTLAKEGDKSDIKVNCIAPIAASKMTETVLPPEVLGKLDPSHITPLVTYLSSEDCDSSGGIYELGGGWYSKVKWSRSMGVALGSADSPATAESIAENMTHIEGGKVQYPDCPSNALSAMTAAAAPPSSSKPTTDTDTSTTTDQSSSSEEKFTNVQSQSEKILYALRDHLLWNNQEASELVTAIGAKVQLNIDNKIWVLDLENPNTVSIETVETIEKKTCRVLIACSEDTMMKLIKGDLSAEFAFMSGSLKIKGQMPLAIKFKAVLKVMNKLL